MIKVEKNDILLDVILNSFGMDKLFDTNPFPSRLMATDGQKKMGGGSEGGLNLGGFGDRWSPG